MRSLWEDDARRDIIDRIEILMPVLVANGRQAGDQQARQTEYLPYSHFRALLEDGKLTPGAVALVTGLDRLAPGQDEQLVGQRQDDREHRATRLPEHEGRAGVRRDEDLLDRKDVATTSMNIGETADIHVVPGPGLRGEFAGSRQDAAVQNTLEKRLARAVQELTPEMQRLLRRPPPGCPALGADRGSPPREDQEQVGTLQ